MNPNLLAWDLTPFSNYTMGKLQPPINFNLKIKIAGKFSQRYISPIYLCLASPLLCQRAPNVLSAVTKPSTENQACFKFKSGQVNFRLQQPQNITL